MLVTCRDNEDRIIAYTEYWITDKWGHPCKAGQFCRVLDVWVHPDYANKGLLKYMLEKKRYKYPLLRWIYWERRNENKPLRTYDIDKLLRRLK